MEQNKTNNNIMDFISNENIKSKIKQAYPNCFTDDFKLIEDNVEEYSIIGRFIEIAKNHIYVKENDFNDFQKVIASKYEDYFDQDEEEAEKEIKLQDLEEFLEEIIKVLDETEECSNTRFESNFEEWLSENEWYTLEAMSERLDKELSEDLTWTTSLLNSFTFYDEKNSKEESSEPSWKYEYVKITDFGPGSFYFTSGISLFIQFVVEYKDLLGI